MKKSGGGGFCFRSLLRLIFFDLVCFFLDVRSHFFGLDVALEYRERFLELAVVLHESGVLEDDGCDTRSEEDDDDWVEEAGGLRLRLRPRAEACEMLI